MNKKDKLLMTLGNDPIIKRNIKIITKVLSKFKCTTTNNSQIRKSLLNYVNQNLLLLCSNFTPLQVYVNRCLQFVLKHKHKIKAFPQKCRFYFCLFVIDVI